MVDADDVRRLALACPEVVEIDSDGFDFRVANRGFVWSYPERVPGNGWVIRTDIAVLHVGDEGEKQALLLGEPEIFFMVPEWDRHPVVLVRLARIDEPRLVELVTDAWRMRAPRDVADQLPPVSSPDVRPPGLRSDRRVGLAGSDGSGESKLGAPQ